MIQMQSKLDVADNTGARTVMYQGVGRLQTSLRWHWRHHQGEHRDAAPRGRVKRATFITRLWFVLPRGFVVRTVPWSNSMPMPQCC